MQELTLETMNLSYRGNVAILTLSREKPLNAMNQDFFNNIKQVINILSSDNKGLGALIITGLGNGFCVGADLKELPLDGELDLSKSLKENFTPMITGLKTLPMPTIAAVNGHCAGAGMGLMLACDFCVAIKSTKFIQAFVNIALVPDAGSTYFLPRLIGRARATEMMMLGEVVSAKDAYRIGLIYKMVEDDQLMTESLKLAHKLATGPTSTIIQIRNLLDASHDNSFSEQLNAEADAQAVAGKSPNFMEGVNAFLEKRLPKFIK